ncbi:uncharacterized protein PV09_03957 [Verruconis gallopava]|uniref:Fe2OG dioxygenase domain-containing protein n=1 Tax=Verruconis gallopava TaxID=253628 RepID=A0A0D1XQ94_9PEZI|nr:uncharacterized protein PV09_03957 [Verruconis gallopava]KIW04766.1 hypothetical protein PV09_03957 [Verruconis gallopava]
MGVNGEIYEPPPGPPPNYPRSYAIDVARQLQPQGWCILSLGSHPHEIYGHDRTYERYPHVWPAIEDLLAASKEFFALEADEKEKFLTRDGSEEGYSSIKGEKEFITLRRDDADHCPDVLRAPAKNAWNAVFGVLNEWMKGIEKVLELPPSSLTRYTEPCLEMDHHARATMLRLFKYENDGAKLVAEPHMDLGLLSLVVGDTPGLEVWDTSITVDGKLQPGWHPIERNFEKGMATLMAGRQLQYLSRSRFNPGGHRVMSYGGNSRLIPKNLETLSPSRTRRLLNRLSLGKPKLPIKEKYRYSIVFVLRAHEPVHIDYPLLESPGFSFEDEDQNIRTAGELFQRLKRAHFNINIGIKEREQQKKKILADRVSSAIRAPEHEGVTSM